MYGDGCQGKQGTKRVGNDMERSGSGSPARGWRMDATWLFAVGHIVTRI